MLDGKDIDQNTKWSVMLELDDYADLKQDLLAEFGNMETIITCIHSLLRMVNSLTTHPLRNTLDGSAMASVRLFRLSIGESHTKLLTCIADKCYIPYFIF
jgi:hypothetical protein